MTERDAGATIDAWRARGADRVDPVRFRFIEALARRTAGHEGAVRQVLEERLAHLLASYDEVVERARGGSAGAAPSAPITAPTPPIHSPLGALLADFARPSGASPAASPADADETLAYLRSTWSRLHAHRRLAQSLAKVPENAGPLNSHHLVHRSLTLMRELSPAYLHRFMAHVDALFWLDQAGGKRG
ncbi:MAG: DUF2894 domain-containing protein [Comamonadaceae bacterium]|nr:MAG: DUF2894 domain-containing protein [Comamonadaceae bacterium]